ncbi:hypothetical protein ABL78_1996 [Leptomonas seymouri]|uniref:Paraquat-inducible protein A n=1 Tax=Leptomonas seymouri TaxID=5684 RepID=A0A0N0P7J9_LEPSE|nr:hypothetical protein ABL78_1996 [Leptomonas seymouri]|eukprot:KPI88879.1 hypothetical protein ABL78_1996 [Leptomonas seymouri]
MQSLCLSFALLLGALNLTSVPVPGFDQSFLGTHAYNLTCTDIVFGSSGADWTTNNSLTTSTTGGSLHCYANFTAYAYAGLVHADIAVGPSNITLTRSPLEPGEEDDGSCFDRSYVLSLCNVQASVTQLYADPPSRIVYMILQQMRETINANLQAYVCSVLIPQIQQDMMDHARPMPPQRNSSSVKRVYPLSDSHLAKAAVNVFSAAFYSAFSPSHTRLSGMWEERALLPFYVSPKHVHLMRSLVAASAGETAMDWLQEVVDAVLSGVVPEPFPVYHLPGKVANVTLDYYVPGDNPAPGFNNGFILVDATMERCDANSCEVYLDPGVEVSEVSLLYEDSVGLLVSRSLVPRLLPTVNEKLNAALRGMAVSQQRNLSDPNVTVHLAFGKKAVLRQVPKVWPLVFILLCAVSGGTWMIRRNVQLHALQPVLCSATGEPVAATRLAVEDTCVVAVATACLLLIASSNSMTGASVLLGEELNTYSFSMWNTVKDLWKAGLIPLSVCVLIFSGIYPYVKLLSLVYFSVWAQRPLSKRLALIDVLGKFSFIDTFALMVMTSGLEIRSAAHVVIHRGFYFFLLATVVSIALGNYITTRYRCGTSHRVRAQAGDDTEYEQVATHDVTAPVQAPSVEAVSEPAPATATVEGVAAAPTLGLALPSLSSVSYWRRYVQRESMLPCVVVLLCSLPAWMFGCLQYTIGGLARVLTPSQRVLSLLELSFLSTACPFSLDGIMAACVFAVALFTILLAPCLFVWIPRRAAFLASWCAADVFVVACVAGLLQLHQFVAFVLGDGMDDVYTARATLRWPMLPLTVAALIVWYFTAYDILGVGCPLKRRG